MADFRTEFLNWLRGVYADSSWQTTDADESGIIPQEYADWMRTEVLS